MTEFIMLVGVAGSGKSTFAKSLLENNGNAIWLSSDTIRKELYGDESVQGSSAEVFKIMLERANKALSLGVNVIYDATNINRKRRKGVLSQLPRNVIKKAFYIHTPYNDIIIQNENRERIVPRHVIDKMYKTLHIPIESEGWDTIDIVLHDSLHDFPDQVKQSIRAGVMYREQDYSIMRELSNFFPAFSDVLELPHDSTYHSFSVSRHIYHVYMYVFHNYIKYHKIMDFNEEEETSNYELMLWVSLLHDVGKKFCKSFYNYKGDESKYANFIGHENVSAQLAVEVLSNLGFSQEFILRATTLIQFHMYLLNEGNNVDKLKNYVGDENYKLLEFIRTGDNIGH